MGILKNLRFKLGHYPNAGVYVADFVNSVSVQLRQDALGMVKPFITHINMGENSTNDCVAYINKLAAFGSNYSPGKLLISASRGGYGNTNYYLDFTAAEGPAVSPNIVGTAAALIQTGAPASSIIVSNGTDNWQLDGHITMATNVAGYVSWGKHSGLGPNYAINGTLQWAGASAWWCIETVESYNGLRYYQATAQGNFIQWFSTGAFGGSNYSNTPIGGVSHVNEPTQYGLNIGSIYFGLWHSGKTFAASAWLSRQADPFQAIGDPLVTR